MPGGGVPIDDVVPPEVVVAVLRALDPEGDAPARGDFESRLRAGLRGRHEARAAGVVVQRQAPREIGQLLEDPRRQRREVVARATGALSARSVRRTTPAARPSSANR